MHDNVDYRAVAVVIAIAVNAGLGGFSNILASSNSSE